MGNYALKRGPWKRKGGPCVECGSESCRSAQSFACWVRCFRRAFNDHNYIRCGDVMPWLRLTDIRILNAPQPGGYEVPFAPAWAVSMLKEARLEAKESQRRLSKKQAAKLLESSHQNRPPPAALVARLDELRAFAVLRGWSYAHGSWYR